MHEYSIVAALVEQVEVAAAGHAGARVSRVHVKIGELAGVEIGLLETAYTTFRERTILADAELRVGAVPARWECGRCRRAIARGERLACPSCGAPARLAEGDEIVLERIEMEVPDHV